MGPQFLLQVLHMELIAGFCLAARWDSRNCDMRKIILEYFTQAYLGEGWYSEGC